MMAEWSCSLDPENIESLYRYIYRAIAIPLLLGQLLIILQWHRIVNPYSWLVGLLIGGICGIFFHYERQWGYPLDSLLTDPHLIKFVRAACFIIIAPAIVIGALYADSLALGKELICVFVTVATTLMVVGIFEFKFVPVDFH